MTYRVQEKTLNMEINNPAKGAGATLRKRKREQVRKIEGDNNKGEKRHEVAQKREKQAKYKRKRRER